MRRRATFALTTAHTCHYLQHPDPIPAWLSQTCIPHPRRRQRRPALTVFMNTACRVRTVCVAFGGFGSQEQKQLQFSTACPKVSLKRYPHDRVRKTGCPTHRRLNLKIELAASTNVLERMYAPQPCWSERGRWPPRPATIQEWHSDPQERAHQQGLKMRQHSLVGHLACRFVCSKLMDQRKTFYLYNPIPENPTYTRNAVTLARARGSRETKPIKVCGARGGGVTAV